MPLAPAVSELARQTMRAAFEELERTVTPADSRLFRSTTLEQTRLVALDIEKELAARRALCNTRRLEPLLRGLEHYSKVIDILCNGTPFLPWIWAPVTLILKAASEYGDSFEQIMKGYSKIAGALNRFKILNDVFTEVGFQQTLAVFYADILKFHTFAYKFVRRSGWKLLFLTSWGRFQRRFDNIIEDLDRHGELIDKEANARSIASVSQLQQKLSAWREESIAQISRDEVHQAQREYQSILSWLKVDETEQLQIFEAVSDEVTDYSGTCSWLLNEPRIEAWLQKKPDKPFIWLQGNPGCGKSVIAASLVGSLQEAKLATVYHFCTYTVPSSTRYDGILKSILRQLLRSDELIAHLYQECIVGKKSASTAYLERLIQMLITSLSDKPCEPLYIWIVIDGINECEPAKQVRLINLLNQVASIPTSSHGSLCKVLLTTRPSSTIRKHFRKNQVIYLSDDNSPLHSAIRMYVTRRLESLDDRLRQLELEVHEIEEIGDLVTKKASGMFLYARLVLDYIGANLFYTGDELRAAIDQLPDSLNEFYQKLLSQILAQLNANSLERVKCIFGWIAFAKRPLKKLEFLSALSFTSGDSKLTRLVPSYIVENICSPLIEERRDGTLTFIHLSVKNFLQLPTSAVVLNEEQALYEHGIAAVTCLLSGLQVLNDSYDQQTRLLRFVKGIHGFHIYATEHWTEYLLANAATSGGLKGKLLEAAIRLDEALEKTGAAERSVPKSSADSKDDRLDLLHQYGRLQKHVERALFARSLRRFESELRISDDPTQDVPKIFDHNDGVSAALDFYQKTVETLLGQNSCPGASVEELKMFKSQFRTSAYTCRLRSCQRATIGFESHKLRHEHEISHAGGFRCSFAGCQYPPYRSQKGLSEHVQSVHSQVVKLPRRAIRRVGNLGPMTFREPRRPRSSPKKHKPDSSVDTTDGTSSVELLSHPSPQPILAETPVGKEEEKSQIKLGAETNDFGSNYLDIVMARINEGSTMDQDLYQRAELSVRVDMEALCLLGEIADSIRDGSATDLTADMIISMVWSKNHPELAQELIQSARGDYPNIGGHSTSSAKADDSAEDAELNAPRHCFCKMKDSNDMIPCDNDTCPHGWFHLACVNRVITPSDNETWFCSKECMEAGETQESSDEDEMYLF